jgi:phosphopantothenoylcysteine decarboxylase/phosphopantothenate--cysteine ligase
MKPSARPRAGLHVVVTAGPTREHVDPVRFLSNESSGRMGFAIAERAARRGHRVTLIAGPVGLETPAGVARIDVVSAREMLVATRRAVRDADALYMAAAVADWRPARRLAGKWRSKDGGRTRARLELVRNPDILATLARGLRGRGRRCLIVAFALETGDGLRRARAKLERKGADFVVLNGAQALNAVRTSVTILGRDKSCLRLARRHKSAVAEALVGLLSRAGR